MHALIVVAHPDPRSLTHAIAERIAEGVTLSGHAHAVEVADLAAERFDPRFTAADLAVHHRETPPPADVAAEQARIDRADALVLVFPVYWWSMPALLKGWIDRVFSNGWAYDYVHPNGPLIKKLGRLPVHLVAVAGSDDRTYARHGYAGAMRTQIDHGIFDYCGAPVAGSHLLFDSESQDPGRHLDAARSIGSRVFEEEAAHGTGSTVRSLLYA